MVDNVEAVAQKFITEEKYSGIEWRIESNGKSLSVGQVGYANFAKQTPIPKNALYRIYSMTKSIVSVLAMMMIERGKIRLYDPISAYDKRFKHMMVLHTNGLMEPADALITIEHLLTHRAGFSYEILLGCQIGPYYREARLFDDSERELDDLVGILADLPIAFHPGTDWRYSVATDVLAHIIEIATGERIDTLLEKHIFEPLGMTETSYCLNENQLPRLMSLYGNQILGTLPAFKRPPHALVEQDVSSTYPIQSPNFRRGGHGLYSTVDDYSKFARMLLNGQSVHGECLLSQRTLYVMHANRLTKDHPTLRIGDILLPGYGWNLTGRVMTDVGKALMPNAVENEFGWAGAAGTFFWVDPKAEITGVIMTQFIRSNYLLAEDMWTAFYSSF